MCNGCNFADFSYQVMILKMEELTKVMMVCSSVLYIIDMYILSVV